MKEQPQRMPFNANHELGTINSQTVDLFISGLHWLNYIAKSKNIIQFSQWAKLLRDARGQTGELSRNKLEWLWEAVSSEPNIRSYFGDRLISIEDEWKEQESIQCMGSKSRFGIFLKNFRAYGHPALKLPKEVRPDAEAVILGPLFMRPGKARRLECCDVSTRLELHLPQFGSKQDEANALKVDVKELKIEQGCLKVSVKSLNHAYTKASLRLEPHRRSHGGRAYDHIAYMKENGQFIPLETIRSNYENKLWSKIIGIK